MKLTRRNFLQALGALGASLFAKKQPEPELEPRVLFVDDDGHFTEDAIGVAVELPLDFCDRYPASLVIHFDKCGDFGDGQPIKLEPDLGDHDYIVEDFGDVRWIYTKNRQHPGQWDRIGGWFYEDGEVGTDGYIPTCDDDYVIYFDGEPV